MLFFLLGAYVSCANNNRVVNRIY